MNYRNFEEKIVIKLLPIAKKEIVKCLDKFIDEILPLSKKIAKEEDKKVIDIENIFTSCLLTLEDFTLIVTPIVKREQKDFFEEMTYDGLKYFGVFEYRGCYFNLSGDGCNGGLSVSYYKDLK